MLCHAAVEIAEVVGIELDVKLCNGSELLFEFGSDRGGKEIGVGIVFVDGVALDEPYTYTPTNVSEGMEFPLVVEDNCIFAMGDNRNRSKDSRHPEIGQIDKREILGKALFLFLPGVDKGHSGPDFDRIGAIK